MRACEQEVTKTPVEESPVAANVGAPPDEASQTVRETFREMVSELGECRELLLQLTLRDIRIRYKQAVVGAGWVILQPLITMMIFTVVFSYMAKIPSDGLPYPIFAYTALLPWTYFSQAVGRSGGASWATPTRSVRPIYPGHRI